MRTARETTAINRMLTNRGLPTLNDNPGELLAAMGALIDDHEEFRSILARIDEPEKRRAYYEAMVGHVHFRAKPLDVYLSESAQLADQRGLPIPDRNGGDYHWPMVQDIRSGLDAAQSAVNQAFAEESLTVTCRFCTKQETFTGDTKDDAILHARYAEWLYYKGQDGAMREICPECSEKRYGMKAVPKRGLQVQA